MVTETVIIYRQESGSHKYMRPSIGHIVPRSKGGTNSIENLCYLTWLESRSKSDMDQSEWDLIKKNIGKYFV